VKSSHLVKKRIYLIEKIFLVTENKYGGCQRKLAWFSKHKNDLYFEVLAFLMGSHISYHKDGSIWRTNPATKKDKIGQYLPLDKFRGWYQLGTSMIEKYLLKENPCLKNRERKKALTIQEVDLEVFPRGIVNMVVEFIAPNHFESISKNFKPPKDARTLIIDSVEPYIVLTILGHHHNLLIRPKEDGFVVSHYNNRYSTNIKGVQYRYEAVVRK
jgi:hypothetical protein